MWMKLLLGAAMVLAGSALVSSCCTSEETQLPEFCNESSHSPLASYVPSLPGPRVDLLRPDAVSGPTCPAVNFLQAGFATAFDTHVSGLQRQPDGSFTRWRYNLFAPYSFFDSTPNYQPAFWNCTAAGTRTFKNPAGWVPLADRLGAMTQPMVFTNLLGNGTPVGLAIVPASFDGGPSAPSLMVAIPNPDGRSQRRQ